MAKVSVDALPDFQDMYRDAGHPLGKNRRGFKKWIKRRIIQALEAWVKRDKENESY